MYRSVCILLALSVAPTPTYAQRSVAEGERVRVMLDDSTLWLRATGLASPADSSTVRLHRSALDVRFAANALRVERPGGRDRGRGLAFGALAGAVGLVTAVLVAPGPKDLGGTIVLPVGTVGALVGGTLGFALAPKGWVPIGTATSSCGNWRLAPGSLATVWYDGTRYHGEVVRHDDTAISLRPSGSGGEDSRLPTSGSRLDLRSIRPSAGVALACP